MSLAKERGESWLARYGGILSAEMLLPKVLETYEKAPEVYADTDVFVDALDWIVWRMTGNLVYSAGDSGYKRNFQDGAYPSEEFLELLSPGLARYLAKRCPGGAGARWLRPVSLPPTPPPGWAWSLALAWPPVTLTPT